MFEQFYQKLWMIQLFAAPGKALRNRVLVNGGILLAYAAWIAWPITIAFGQNLWGLVIWYIPSALFVSISLFIKPDVPTSFG